MEDVLCLARHAWVSAKQHMTRPKLQAPNRPNWGTRIRLQSSCKAFDLSLQHRHCYLPQESEPWSGYGCRSVFELQSAMT